MGRWLARNGPASSENADTNITFSTDDLINVPIEEMPIGDRTEDAIIDMQNRRPYRFSLENDVSLNTTLNNTQLQRDLYDRLVASPPHVATDISSTTTSNTGWLTIDGSQLSTGYAGSYWSTTTSPYITTSGYVYTYPIVPEKELKDFFPLKLGEKVFDTQKDLEEYINRTERTKEFLIESPIAIDKDSILGLLCPESEPNDVELADS